MVMTPSDQPKNDLSRIGVVIIGRNEGERLVRCLESVGEGVGGVVYVDSGSSDGSVAAASAALADVIELDTTRPFTAARARHVGVERIIETQPNCDILFFIDGDCEVCEGWIEAGLDAMVDRHELAAVSGRIIEKHPEASIYNRLMQLEWDRPSGDVDACPGISLMRLEAYTQAGGFDPSVIAGEEPELCLRMRRQGWKIARIDHDMVRHDAAIKRFGQWWKRCERGGYAASLGMAMHGSGPERYNVARVRRALVWGLVIPVLTLGLVWLTPYALLLGLLYPVQASRMALRIRNPDRSTALTLIASIAQVLDKFPQAVGVLRHRWQRLLGRTPKIIEYKDVAASDAKSIVYLAPMLPAASETFVYREIRGLRNRGHSVRVVSLRDPGSQHDASAPDMAEQRIVVYGKTSEFVLHALKGVRSPARFLKVLTTAVVDAIVPGEPTAWSDRVKLIAQAVAGISLASALRQLEPSCQHIHAHFAHAPTSVAMYAALHLGIPFSFTGHANDIFQRRQLLRRKLRRAAGVACISEWHRDLYTNLEPAARQRYAIIRCGVDTEEWRPIAPETNPSNQSLQVFSVGRFVEKKGFDLFVEAVSRVADDRHDVTGLLLGDGPERANIESKLRESGGCSVVKMPGSAANEQVRQAMLRADIFLLPCREDSNGDRDGLPVVLLEAMSCGLPVIVGDLPAIRELVRNGETGLLIDSCDASGASDALAMLVHDADLRDRLSMNGRRRVIEEFSAVVNLVRLEKLFGLPVLASQKTGSKGSVPKGIEV